MKRVIVFTFGVVSYLLFFCAFLYWIGFMGNIIVPKGIDSGTSSPLIVALLINFLLISLFGAQHSVMARGNFKKWITKFLPESAERSFYVLISTIFLSLLFWQWRPINNTIWSVSSPLLQNILWGVFALGWVILLIATFLINHFELFGLQQVYVNLRKQPMVYPKFQQPMLYKIVRHPMMIGVMLAVWATPTMTLGHLFFAVFMSGYILIGTHYEEKDLVKKFGKQYEKYQNTVPQFIPVGKKKKEESFSTS